MLSPLLTEALTEDPVPAMSCIAELIVDRDISAMLEGLVGGLYELVRDRGW